MGENTLTASHPRPGTPPPPPQAVAAAAALASPSRRAIAACLAEEPAGLSVAQLAERVALHPNAVRQHLKVLAAAGVVGAGVDAPSGRGRPGGRYRLIDDGAGHISAHQELVRMLVALLRRVGAGPETLEQFGREHGPTLISGGGRTAVTTALMRLAFAPHETTAAADAERGRLDLRLDNCPFRDAVASPGGEAVCALHRGLLAGMATTAAPGGALLELLPKDPARAGCIASFTGLPPG